ncbi:MAG: hypothetical protein PHO83_10780 [Geobacteraceae bacterium]|nr:hypothetical protein [Geobacteraceae bacterium]
MGRFLLVMAKQSVGRKELLDFLVLIVLAGGNAKKVSVGRVFA